MDPFLLFFEMVLIANISIFQGIGDKSQKQYFEMTIRDRIENGKSMLGCFAPGVYNNR